MPSSRVVVIVNGVPGSGKATLLDELGYANHEQSRRIGRASGEVIWSLLGTCPLGAVIDTWLAPETREIVATGLRRANIERSIEVWCECEPDVVRQRYQTRERHPGHFDHECMDPLNDWLAMAKPLALGDVLRVQTTEPVDVVALAQLVVEHFRPKASS